VIPDLDGYLEAVEGACPGPCNKPFWRVHAKALAEVQMAYATRAERTPYVPDEGVVAGALEALHQGSPHWCRACADTLRATVGALPGLAEACARRRDGKVAAAPASEVRVAAVAAPSPSPGWDALDQIGRWLADWAGEVADLAGTPRPWNRAGGGGLQLELRRHAAYLAGHWSVVMACDDAVRFGNEARDLELRAKLTSGTDELEHHLPMPCMGCDTKALFRTDGAERVTCRHCKKSWEWKDYERLGVAYRESGAAPPPAHRRPHLGSSDEGYGGAA
jgi:hypothetical protein